MPEDLTPEISPHNKWRKRGGISGGQNRKKFQKRKKSRSTPTEGTDLLPFLLVELYKSSAIHFFFEFHPPKRVVFFSIYYEGVFQPLNLISNEGLETVVVFPCIRSN